MHILINTAISVRRDGPTPAMKFSKLLLHGVNKLFTVNDGFAHVVSFAFRGRNVSHKLCFSNAGAVFLCSPSEVHVTAYSVFLALKVPIN